MKKDKLASRLASLFFRSGYFATGRLVFVSLMDVLVLHFFVCGFP